MNVWTVSDKPYPFLVLILAPPPHPSTIHTHCTLIHSWLWCRIIKLTSDWYLHLETMKIQNQSRKSLASTQHLYLVICSSSGIVGWLMGLKSSKRLKVEFAWLCPPNVDFAIVYQN